MKKKLAESKTAWVDPDDAPEWTDEMFDRSDLYEGEVLISRGRPSSEGPLEEVTLRLSPEVLAHFRGTGFGWQRKIDEALRKAIEG